jgi:hypothetical protein
VWGAELHIHKMSYLHVSDPLNVLSIIEAEGVR